MRRCSALSEHGRWKIAPRDEITRRSRRYRANTLILETRFETADGAVDLIDFMPPRGKASDVVRLVRGVRGRIRMRMDLVIRFGFGVDIPWVRKNEDGTATARDLRAGHDGAADAGRDPRRRHDDGRRFRGRGRRNRAVRADLSRLASARARADRPGQALQDTEAFWREWCERCTYEGEQRDLVLRSLITLKALTYAPTGGIVAAPTTSLPEKLGGARNWDYRFCWLRDATFTLLALINSGYYRRGAGLARLAAARGRGLARRDADHVRHHGPAPAAGMGGAVAAGL